MGVQVNILADCSPTNNTVFARTYDLNIGGWGSSYSETFSQVSAMINALRSL